MELKIKPYDKNIYPIGGILIRDAFVINWIKEIQLIGFNLDEIKIYPIPATKVNTIWGCLILSQNKLNLHKIGKNELFQIVSSNLFIAEKSIISPSLTMSEIEKLFASGMHLIHPDVGIVEFLEELNISKLIKQPELKNVTVRAPEKGVFIPKKINSFQVLPVSSEEVLKNLEHNIFPKKEKLPEQPLTLFEKGKLALYKALFFKTTNYKSSLNSNSKIHRNAFLEKIESLINAVTKNSSWVQKLEEDYENLEERNQKQIDKLMDLLKKNPEEALKYAIPLDGTGTTRGGVNQRFELSKRWFDFSLFSGSVNTGTGSIDLGIHYNVLQDQYNKTAQDLINNKEYLKAAFVYMKLLKNYHLAAKVLEDGKHYQESATIYLKHLNDKKKAAECYEKGNLIADAIDLYKDLGENEKVGDLYISIHKKKEAEVYYVKVIDEYTSRNQYVKASLIYKVKMQDAMRGQALLKSGWLENKDAVNCLNNYFNNIKDLNVLKNEINQVFKNELKSENKEHFISVIKLEYQKNNELASTIREMAYQVVADHIHKNPAIVKELKAFNPKDFELSKDVLRFKINK